MLVNVPGQVALERSYLAQLRGDAMATAAFAARVLACSGEDGWLLRSTARGFLAVAEWLHRRLARAERAFVSGIAGWRSVGQATVAAWGDYQLGQVQRGRGRLDAAVLTCQQALQATAGSGGMPLPASGPAHVGLGEVAYQRNELDLALRHVTEGIALCRRFVYTPPLAAGLVTLAWIRQATGDRAGALEAIEQAARPRRYRPACSTRSRRAGAATAGPGRPRRGRALGAGLRPRCGRRAGRLARSGPSAAGPRAARPGPAGRALTLLDRLHEVAAAQDRSGSIIEIGALRALALAASGEKTAAVIALAGALALACPQGYVRVFADEGHDPACLPGLSGPAGHRGRRRSPAGLPGAAPARLRRRVRLRRSRQNYPGSSAQHGRSADQPRS